MNEDISWVEISTKGSSVKEGLQSLPRRLEMARVPILVIIGDQWKERVKHVEILN